MSSFCLKSIKVLNIGSCGVGVYSCFLKSFSGKEFLFLKKAEFPFCAFAKRAFRAWEQVCFSRSDVSETLKSGVPTRQLPPGRTQVFGNLSSDSAPPKAVLSAAHFQVTLKTHLWLRLQFLRSSFVENQVDRVSWGLSEPLSWGLEGVASGAGASWPRLP